MLRKLSALLAGLLTVTAFAGCSGDSSDSADAESSTATVDAPDTTAEETTEPAVVSAVDGDIVIVIDSVEITLDALKAQEYVVPVYVNLTKNSGIIYFEWGASVDSRCSFASTIFDSDVEFTTYAADNNDAHFLWAVWASAEEITDETKMLRIDVTLPQDAAVGDVYPVTYAYQSIGASGKIHKWLAQDTDWVEQESVSWTDGGITIVG